MRFCSGTRRAGQQRTSILHHLGQQSLFIPCPVLCDHPPGPCTVLQPHRQVGITPRQITVFLPPNSQSICPSSPAAPVQPGQPTPLLLPPIALPAQSNARTRAGLHSLSFNQPQHIVQEQWAPLMYYRAAYTAFSQL